MISFKSFLAESRSAPLYHATTYINVIQILKDNNLKAGRTHSGARTAISLTRSINTAWAWRETWRYGVVIELNQRKLAQTHSIKPIEVEYEWASEASRKAYVNKSSGLFEEYVTKDIKPLDKYLVAIHLTQKLKDRMLLLNDPKDAIELLKNPLVKVHYR